jgi:predicted nucleotidyltransferase
MNNAELLNKNKLLEEELQKIKNELIDTKEHLKKYTAPIRHKTYYENHKQELLEKMKSNPIPTDKRKEYNKKYYLKKKENNSENI